MAEPPPVSGLWAITTYFNAMGYGRRPENYRAFRRHLRVPLLTVELAYGEAFSLRAGDAEIVVQRRGHDVLWQKERLLNVALDELPDECTHVAWIDCDLVFDRPDWAGRALDALETHRLVQPFARVRHLAPDADPDRTADARTLLVSPGLGATLATGIAPEEVLGRLTNRSEGASSSGMAWVAERARVARHGFFDACVIGGGDNAMASAALGAFETVMRVHAMNDRQRRRYREWAEPYHREMAGPVGYIEGDVCHLWHGSLEDRRPRARHEGFAAFEFDPYADVSVAESGCWRWSSDKPAMHRYVRDYFAARREDG